MKGVSLSKKTEQERLRLLYAPMLANHIIGSTVVTVIILILFAAHISWWRLMPWTVLALATAGYHGWLHLAFQQVRDRQDFSTQEWEQKFLLGVGLVALVWGSACALLYVAESVSHQNYLLLLVSGVSVVAIKLLSPSLNAMLIYAAMAIGPLLIMVVVTGQLLGLPLLAYLAFQGYISYSHGKKFQHDYFTSQSMAFASKQREMAWRKRDDRHLTWFKNSADASLLVSPEKIYQANPAAAKLLGYVDVKALLKVKPKQLVLPPNPSGRLSPDAFKAAKASLEQQGSCQVLGTGVRRDGSHFPVELTLTAVPLKSGLGCYCVVRDATGQQQQVAQLTEQINSAEAENQAKSAYYEHISQAVFTPLNGVLSHANVLLQNKGLNPDQQMRTRVIKRSADALLNVFNDILDVTKLDAGTLQLVERDFDLKALLQSFIDTAQERCEAKGLGLKHHIDPNMHPYYKGDDHRLSQILEQLFSNALKHTEQGEIKLLAKMVKKNRAGAMLRFDVIDSGPGVKKSQQAHLFNRFVQADGSASGSVGGTGLGLSLAQGLAQLMGGQVGYSQHKGHGAHFWLTVRLYKAAGIKNITQAMQAKQKGIQTLSAKVLVVDDNRTSLLVAKGTLEVFGLDIDLVNSGQEAIYMLRQHDYDLVIMDCLMPKMDGYQTTRKIRSLSSQVKNPNIPIIAMTSNDQEGAREACLEAGMNDYMTKPIDIRLIQQMLQFWLLKKQ
ncbi:response regulator [Marinicella meishanensis]|uniref:response regulator n=1 Tax=Marinicella meishanensis TaxID=2873263 RepID=UPI001CC06856|nr:response regulator [Marinicella sp. NBU2979]